tara:strand:+ start:252 stop:1361 length:1110 start_codon:yes stop_codon:yes gene_type:complete
LKILLIETYFTGSHKQWAEGYKNNSSHQIKILSMPGRFWKWRMHGGAVTLAREYKLLEWNPELIIVTDMLDLTTFIGLAKKEIVDIPIALYFHENQINYPWSPNDRDKQKKRDNHYGFINYASALAADRVFFNSNFHKNTFLNSLTPFLKNFPDHNELSSIDNIKSKSEVLYLGLDLSKFDSYEVKNSEKPLILWNHRWEYDKNPELFFSTLEKIKNNGQEFELAILGENFSKCPTVFEKAKKVFKENIVQFGFAHSFEDYANWLWKADILPVTSDQDFFGVSIIEAIYCGTWVILPNQLAYPELLPVKLHQNHLYNSEKELQEKINWALSNYKQIRLRCFQNTVKHFNWKNLVSHYDNKMQKIKKIKT